MRCNESYWIKGFRLSIVLPLTQYSLWNVHPALSHWERAHILAPHACVRIARVVTQQR